MGPVNTGVTCKYRHGLVVRLWDGNHSDLGSKPKRTPRSLAQKFAFLRYHYYVLLHVAIITSLLQIHCYVFYFIITSLLHHYYVIITSSLHHHYIIITHY